MLDKCTQKENVDNYFVYVFPGIAKRPYCLNKYMPTPLSVNSYFCSCNILQIGDLGIQESKSGCSNPICP